MAEGSTVVEGQEGQGTQAMGQGKGFQVDAAAEGRFTDLGDAVWNVHGPKEMAIGKGVALDAA